jgi:tRNA G18 (ribose-2'-O)-methylase SpoU
MEDERQIGVGPHARPWPSGNQYDPELLENGDRRNVEDKYRYWTIDAIKADLQSRSVPLHIAIENWQHDSNIGTIVRTANAFNVRAVHIIGRRHWNKRGAMVTDRYLDVFHHGSVEQFVSALPDYHFVGVDNIEGSKPLSNYKPHEKTVLIFGGEGPGLSRTMQDACQKIVKINQYGSTRSLNIGVAAGIAMHEYMRHYHS